MAGKRRALPSWMSGREDKGKGKDSEREPLKSKKRRKTARTAFYCMNEQELVEAAAAAVLSACEVAVPPSDHKVRNEGEEAAAPADLTCAATESAEESGDMTYVSESDLDITEVETLPYAGSPRPERSGGQRPEESKSGGTDAGPPAEGGGEAHTPQDAEKDDDALRLVREIFFN